MIKKLLAEVIFGKNTQISGLIALAIVGSIALGCSCNKGFDLGNLGKGGGNDGPTPAPFNTSSTPTPTTTTSTPYTGKKADASKYEVPGNGEMQEIAKKTLLDFNDAVLSDDFTNFYSNICKPWKKQITADALRTTFKVFVDKKIDISPIRSLDADFSPAPSVSKVVGFQTLVVKGTYQTSPNLTKVELNYIPEGKEWKLSKIDVDTTQKNY